MKNQKFKITIVGLTPYMQHRMDDESLDEWEKRRGRIIERKGINDPDEKKAEYHCYRDGDKCYMPNEHLKGSFINAGSFMKAKVGNSRKSMKNIVAAMFYIEPEKIQMPDYDAIDKRSAVNHNNKARVITVRPKWTEWEITFNLIVANETITKETIEQIIDYAGNYVGAGSFRPQHNGEFGRFELKSIQKV